MFVIPMAGESRRFTEAGYGVPKYRLEAHGRSLFQHSVSSFSAYFDSQPFLFVFREAGEESDFIRGECRCLGIRDAAFVPLSDVTAGQAETVLLGLDRAKVSHDTPVTIFNIDTFRPGFSYPSFVGSSDCDGYLEVFEGSGDNWSFMRPDPTIPGVARETSEKRPISNLCCTGLYHFAMAGLFREAYRNPGRPKGAAERRERYVAPLYNALISAGRSIRYDVIAPSQVVFCGVPGEYEAFRSRL